MGAACKLGGLIEIDARGDQQHVEEQPNQVQDGLGLLGRIVIAGSLKDLEVLNDEIGNERRSQLDELGTRQDGLDLLERILVAGSLEVLHHKIGN